MGRTSSKINLWFEKIKTCLDGVELRHKCNISLSIFQQYGKDVPACTLFLKNAVPSSKGFELVGQSIMEVFRLEFDSAVWDMKGN